MEKTEKINKIKKKFKKDFWIRTGIALLLVATISLGSLSFVQAEDEASDYSFYTLSSVMAMALSTCAADPSDPYSITAHFGELTENTAGGTLGYPDSTKSRGTVGLCGASTSESAVTYDYRQLCEGQYGIGVGQHAAGGPNSYVFTPYCALGAALADLGIDQTGTESDNTAFRSSVGGIVLMTYVSAQCVNVVFKFVINLMIKLNPFQFFANANNQNNVLVDHAGLRGENNAFSLPELDGVSNIISRFYVQIYDLGIVVLVVMMAVMLAGILMYRTFIKTYDSRLGMVKKYVIRAAFIILGIPVLGATYTSILNMVNRSIDSGNTAAAKVVASTFCDFEGWVMNINSGNSLKLPIDIDINYDSGHIRAAGKNSPQKLCYAINTQVNSGLQQNVDPLIGGQGDSIEAIISSIQSASLSSQGKMKENVNSWIIDLLGRYMTGKKIYASSYEQTWISRTWVTTDVDRGNLQKFVERLDSVSDIMTYAVPQKLWQTTDYSMHSDINLNGPIYNPFGVEDDDVLHSADLRGHGTYSLTDKLQLSPMSIYNYLNSTFDETSIKVYSSEKSSSTYIREHHYSVNAVGKGTTSLIILALCVVLLATYSILGFVYAFGIVLSNIKRGVRLIIAVPGAMVGSLQCIAKVVSYAVLMIVELIVNIMLYTVLTDLLFALTIVVTSTFNSKMGEVFELSQSFQFDLTPVLGFVAVVFMVWFCKQCIELRKPINSALEQMADNVIKRFIMGTGGYMGGGMYSGSVGYSGYSSGNTSSATHSTTNTASMTSAASAGNNQIRTMGDAMPAVTSVVQNLGQTGAGAPIDTVFAKGGEAVGDVARSIMKK